MWGLELPSGTTRFGDRAATVREQLDSLTGMRFLAALLVVLHHTVSNPVAGSRLVRLSALRPIATVGYSGVTFFFVLSGFVLAWSWSTGSARLFFARRFARIYPLHVLTWALSFLLLWQLDRDTPLVTAVLCLFLLQAWSTNDATAFGQNPVSWSLSCEAFFYALFPFLVGGLNRLTSRAIVATIAGLVAFLAALPVIVYEGLDSRADVQYLYYLPAYRIGEFVVGVGLALLVRRGLRLTISAGLATAAAALWLVGVSVLNTHAHAISQASGPSGLPRIMTCLLVLPIVAVWILAAASADVDGRPSLLRGRVLRRLGIWSYALYLTHVFVLRELERATGSDVPHALAGRIVLALAAMSLVIAVSGAVYHFVERPLERDVRRRLRAQRPTRSSHQVAAATSEEAPPSSQQVPR